MGSVRFCRNNRCVTLNSLCFSFLIVVLYVSKVWGQGKAGGGARSDSGDYLDNIASASAPGNPGTAPDYYEDTGDVEFDSHPPNILVLLADPNNGTAAPLSHAKDSDVTLKKELGKVHLFCSAYYPIRWTYRGEGFPFLNVDNTRFVEDFYDPTSYAFSALLELEGLLESQTGNYTCQKWDDETLASSFYVYIPGERILLLEKNSSLSVELNSTEITIPCSVSDPSANVTLKKLLPKGKDLTDWSPVSSSLYSYSPKTGFTFSGSETPTGIGSFLCSTRNEEQAEITISVKDKFVEEKSESGKDMCCDKKLLRSLGDERTSCRGFISHTCQTPEYLTNSTSPCTDWKIADFLRNPVELCKEEISPQGATTGVGYYKAEDHSGHHLFVYCQADPKEFTQGFKMALQFQNGSVLFIDDERHKVPVQSEFPSGYEVNAEITDLIQQSSSLKEERISIHCYIPLKFSFKWIKISKDIPHTDLAPFDLNSNIADIDDNSLSESSAAATANNNKRNGPPAAVTSHSTSLHNTQTQIGGSFLLLLSAAALLPRIVTQTTILHF